MVGVQVNDGKLSSDIKYVTITAGAANVAPTAIVSAIPPANVGREVLLDASGSTDPNGDVLIYRWALTYTPAMSSVAISDPSAARQRFTPDRAGVYVFTLVVNDGRLDSPQLTVAVTVAP